MIDWLKDCVGDKDDPSDDTAYSLIKISAAFETKKICEGGWLVLKWDDIHLTLDFAVLDFYWSEEPYETNIFVKNVFYGSGPSQNLRECRHTYWGEDGYLFYPNGKVICAGLKALSEFYDDIDPGYPPVGEKK